MAMKFKRPSTAVHTLPQKQLDKGTNDRLLIGDSRTINPFLIPSFQEDHGGQMRLCLVTQILKSLGEELLVRG